MSGKFFYRATRAGALATLLATAFAGTVKTAEVAQGKNESVDGFQEFSDRLQAFMKLRKSAEGKLPALKPTDVPELIVAHQEAMAREIREARVGAKRGDIFTERAQQAFQSALHTAFKGAQSQPAKATLAQGEPVNNVRLQVNQSYPDGLPFTTVPPTLLRNLPQLPKDIAYRIVGRDFALLDAKANLVIDILPDALR